MEMELKRGKTLRITGAPEITEKFILLCDGERIQAAFDSSGTFSMPLKEGGEKVFIRLEKSGEKYPVFHAVLTFD